MNARGFSETFEDEANSCSLTVQEQRMTSSERERYNTERVLEFSTIDVPWLTEEQVRQLVDKLSYWLGK